MTGIGLPAGILFRCMLRCIEILLLPVHSPPDLLRFPDCKHTAPSAGFRVVACRIQKMRRNGRILYAAGQVMCQFVKRISCHSVSYFTKPSATSSFISQGAIASVEYSGVVVIYCAAPVLTLGGKWNSSRNCA